MSAPRLWEQDRRHRSRLRVLEAALSLFAEQGFEATTFQSIAARAGVSAGLACRYFPTREHLCLAVYDGLARDLAAWVPEMPEGTVAARFRAVVEAKLRLVAPHRRALLSLAAVALDPDGRAAVLGEAAAVVRSRVSGVFAAAVAGASDAPDPTHGRALARVLYGVHLALILLWLQDRSPDAASVRAVLDLLDPLVAVAPSQLGHEALSTWLDRVDAVFRPLLQSAEGAPSTEKARAVLERIFRRRRVLPGVEPRPTEAAFALHLDRVRVFVDAGEPIPLVLPAFPAKAPNPRKVLGRLPDLAERLALESLAALLDEIAEAHPPGATLLLASDGHVFADVVGVSDADVDRYRASLEALVAEIAPSRVRVFGLADAFDTRTHAQSRQRLLERYAQSPEAIVARAKRSAAHGAQLDGIHRFLFEDAAAREPERSRTQLRKATRPAAVEVVRRSDAWGALLAAAFPKALRLSIHPQPDVSEKIGVHLLATEDAWLTPWHGAALFDGARYQLVRRAEVPDAAMVLDDDGLPSHLERR